MGFSAMYEAAAENVFLLEIALLLLAAFIGGRISTFFKMPEVLGQILVGILIGPTVLDLVDLQNGNELIHSMAEIGVVFLMFLAGLETDLQELKSSGKGASLIALGGVFVPMLFGTVVSFGLFPQYIPFQDPQGKILSAIYIGTILTATSVSISVSVLRDMGKLNSKVGVSILGAAIIDDVLGIVLLAVITGMVAPGAGANSSIGFLLLRIAIFFIISIILGGIISKLISKYASNRAWKDSFICVAIIICFLFAFSAEMFKVAAITGAYVAGVICAATPFRHKIVRRIQYVAYSLFTPIFFVSIGLRAHITSEVTEYIGYALILVLAAILGKIIGCGFGARISGFDRKESLQIGSGMIARAEVALIVATQGLNRGIISHQTFTSIVLLVVISTIVTPPLLKTLFTDKKIGHKGHKKQVAKS